VHLFSLHPGRRDVRAEDSVPVRIVVEAGPYRGVAARTVARAARAMLAALRMEAHELSIVLTDDAHIRTLNRAYRKKDRPTDVLAFAQREGDLGDRAGRLLGDVVVSIPTAQRQADAQSKDALSEVLWLLGHGLLHLLGWDHDTPARDRRMRRETARIVAAAKHVATPSRRRAR
jgi:probable rRNA maturation factor